MNRRTFMKALASAAALAAVPFSLFKKAPALDLKDGKWHHFMVEYDTSHGVPTVYVDGALVGEKLPADALLADHPTVNNLKNNYPKCTRVAFWSRQEKEKVEEDHVALWTKNLRPHQNLS